ncbi:hypothetical protein [Streptomyces alanosinicus]|uniref:hypothetical protein n=1 Tax=Streptomyces alanosinicus TaxID=68171 RepID=UPI0016756C39|nr:hypothetical protein [Streptomyces alanosinicus]
MNKALNPDGAEAEQDPAAVADRDKQLGNLAAELRTARAVFAAYKACGRTRRTRRLAAEQSRIRRYRRRARPDRRQVRRSPTRSRAP